MGRRETEARRWWRQAERDLESAEINAREARHEVACFLCQQAADKAVKGLLYAGGESPVLGHSLLSLTKRARDRMPSLPDLRGAAKTLDGYYVAARYPNGHTDDVTPADFYDASDSARALSAAREVMATIAPHLPTP